MFAIALIGVSVLVLNAVANIDIGNAVRFQQHSVSMT